VWDRFGLAGISVALVTLTLIACLVRASGVPEVQGTMGRDEARLALAARGILETGLPILPGGFLYTRGLVPAYLNAASFAILGTTDQAARLTDLVFSTLLVVAVYQVGRLAGGHRAAMAAAIVVAFSPPLVLQAREAWLYNTFLFWVTMALGWLVRDGPGDRVRAGLAALAALFSHELAVLFVPVALAIDLGRAWTARRRRARREARAVPPQIEAASDTRRGKAWQRDIVVFWVLLLAGAATVGALSLLLRAPTLGGPATEIREYLRPGFDLRGLDATLDILGGWYPWLLPSAILGLPLTRGGWRGLVAGRGVAPSLLMVLAVVAFNSFGLVRRGESRYMLAALPFLAIVAAVALDRVGPSIVAGLMGRRRLGPARHITRFVLLTLLVAVCFDPARLMADARSRNVTGTWVHALADRSPDDLVVSFAPTLTSYYLGRTDYWVRPDGYAKYVWAGRSPLRDVHTGAVVLRNAVEVDRLLRMPNQGRTAWVVLAGPPASESSRDMRELSQQFVALAAESRRAPDGRLVLRLQL
jgi:hypothetical protein